jgi:hypothetical protein
MLAIPIPTIRAIFWSVVIIVAMYYLFMYLHNMGKVEQGDKFNPTIEDHEIDSYHPKL